MQQKGALRLKGLYALHAGDRKTLSLALSKKMLRCCYLKISGAPPLWITTSNMATPVSSHIVVRVISMRLVSHVFQLQQQDR